MNKDILKLQKPYMETICEEQIIHLLIINVCCWIYGVFAYFFLSDKLFTDIIHGQSEYKGFLIVTIVITIYLLYGKINIPKEEVAKRSVFARVGIDLCSEGYLCWSGMAMYYSIIEGRSINFMVWLMVMGLAVSTFFFGLWDFTIIYVINTVFALAIVNVFFNGEIDRGTFINLALFTFMFAVIYVSKHFSELRSYENNLKIKRIEDAKKLLTASMNHELRTPLNSIIGNAQIMLTRQSIAGDDREILDNIFNSSNTMVQLVNDILDYSKLESGEFQIIPAEFDLRDLKNNIEGMLKNLAKDKGLEFEVMIDDGTPLNMIGDMRRIQQIAINVASNGIKYTKEGKVKVAFTVWQNTLNMKIKDTGMGMSQETAQAMFNPFNRGDEKAVANIQGTGLGMFIVKNLTDQMKGKIEVNSELGVGTIVRVSIPVEIVNEELVFNAKELKKSGSSETAYESNFDFTGKVILSVDDTVMNNKLIQNFLADSGATVYSMLDAERCLKFLNSQHADIILLDHLMPGMDGIECLDKIRNGADNVKDTPVIMFTGNAGEEYQQLYKEHGADGYILKPVMREKLLKLIKETMK